jgi:Domain of unknown function (DUF6647)
MSHSVFHICNRSYVYRLLLGASLILQTNQVAALDNVIDEINTISTTSASVVIKGHLNLAGTASNDKALVRQLIIWINEHTSFSYRADKIPVVKHIPAKQMVEVAFKKNYSKILDQKTFNILGLYNFEDNAIYLLDNIDLQAEKGKGILLHELIHFLQYQYGHDKIVSCMNELEAMAYLMETKYLAEHDQTYSSHHTNLSQRSICTS